MEANCYDILHGAYRLSYRFHVLSMFLSFYTESKDLSPNGLPHYRPYLQSEDGLFFWGCRLMNERADWVSCGIPVVIAAVDACVDEDVVFIAWFLFVLPKHYRSQPLSRPQVRVTIVAYPDMVSLTLNRWVHAVPFHRMFDVFFSAPFALLLPSTYLLLYAETLAPLARDLRRKQTLQLTKEIAEAVARLLILPALDYHCTESHFAEVFRTQLRNQTLYTEFYHSCVRQPIQSSDNFEQMLAAVQRKSSSSTLPTAPRPKNPLHKLSYPVPVANTTRTAVSSTTVLVLNTAKAVISPREPAIKNNQGAQLRKCWLLFLP